MPRAASSSPLTASDHSPSERAVSDRAEAGPAPASTTQAASPVRTAANGAAPAEDDGPEDVPFQPPRFNHVPFTLAKRPPTVPATCGACGGRVGPAPRFCAVLGIFCCAACHDGGTVIVPAHVVQYWDFTPYGSIHASRVARRATLIAGRV